MATVDELLAAIPPGPEYDLLRSTISLIGTSFPSELDEIDVARVQGWVNEIAGFDQQGDSLVPLPEGAGRTVEQIRADIFTNIVGTQAITEFANQFGLVDEGETLDTLVEQLISGETSFFGQLQDAGLTPSEAVLDLSIEGDPIGVGGTTLPAGGTLVRVADPTGSDADVLNFVVYEINGIQIAYEIGDDAALEEVFQGDELLGFDTLNVDDATFQDQFITVGNVDEILGSDESLASVFERDLAALGLESLPDWVVGDEEAMTLMVIGTNEGWSPGRLANALAGTEAFTQRYSAFDSVAEYLGTNDVLQVVATYTAWEGQLSAALNRFRGPNTDTSQEYLAELITTGWSPDDLIPVLEAEQFIIENPEAVEDFEAILEFTGLGDFDGDIIDVMTGNAPSDVLEAINSTLIMQSLGEEGVDIDAAFATELGEGQEGVVAPDVFSQQAQQIASVIARNFNALQTDAFGLERDDIVAAMFGEESPTGRSASEIQEVLLQIGRNAAGRAGGIAGPQSFVNARGRLQLQGFSGL